MRVRFVESSEGENGGRDREEEGWITHEVHEGENGGRDREGEGWIPTKYTLNIHCRYDPSEGMSVHIDDGDDDFSKYHCVADNLI